MVHTSPSRGWLRPGGARCSLLDPFSLLIPKRNSARTHREGQCVFVANTRNFSELGMIPSSVELFNQRHRADFQTVVVGAYVGDRSHSVHIFETRFHDASRCLCSLACRAYRMVHRTCILPFLRCEFNKSSPESSHGGVSFFLFSSFQLFI